MNFESQPAAAEKKDSYTPPSEAFYEKHALKQAVLDALEAKHKFDIVPIKDIIEKCGASELLADPEFVLDLINKTHSGDVLKLADPNKTGYLNDERFILEALKRGQDLVYSSLSSAVQQVEEIARLCLKNDTFDAWKTYSQFPDSLKNNQDIVLQIAKQKVEMGETGFNAVKEAVDALPVSLKNDAELIKRLETMLG